MKRFALLTLPLLLAMAGAAEPAALENAVLRVEISLDNGRIAVIEKASGQRWEQPVPQAKSPAITPTKPAVYRLLSKKRDAVEVEREFSSNKNERTTLKLKFSLPSSSAPDLRIESNTTAPSATLNEVGFLLDVPRGVLAVADYSNGHLYPLDLQPFPRTGFSGDRLDLPWVGLCDLDSGRGYMVLLETCDDANVVMQKAMGKDGRALVVPQIVWRPEKGAWAYPRRVLCHFAPSGGYVALCKRYRAYAKEHGLIVPFTQKLRKNPNIQRLFGAPDVWGNASLSFAREAKATGVEKMLIHGRPAKPEDMRAINDLGYLTSEYDNYTDILQTKDGKVSSNHAILPDHAVQKSDGERMTAWLTWDKKTQYMKRCPTLWMDAAKATAEKVLSEWPFLGRFIDVTTAEGAYECYDPKHSMTRTQKSACGPALHRVFRERGLVMGGEHGIWWCAPWVDYIEGMQSGGYASWPAGHLIHPKTKDQEFEGAWGKLKTKWETYAKWGIGHEYRAPLWELVFHDCIVSTRYWGDASDFLLDAAPEITPKKDAFNILYGTIPLLWANKEGGWNKDRAAFLRTYRNTCKLHEVLATAELVSHEFMTPDHALQRTRFSDGTECVVNFGEKPQRVTVGGREFTLPQNGWAVKGPKIEQSLALEDGKSTTSIRTSGYAFSDRGGVPVTMNVLSPGQARVTVDKPAARVTLHPGETAKSWKAAKAALYKLDGQGQPVDVIPFTVGAKDEMTFEPATGAASFLLLWGSGSRQVDLRLSDLKFEPATPKQGDRLRVTATVANAGFASAGSMPVDFLVDGKTLSRASVSVKANGAMAVVAEIDTALLDGERRLEVVVDPAKRLKEVSTVNNRKEQLMQVAPDWSRWPHRKNLVVKAAGIAREDEVVTVPFELPAGGDAQSVRVAAIGENQTLRAVPAQLDGRELSFVMSGNLDPNASRRFAVLWRDQAAGAMALPPGAGFWREAQQTVFTPFYEARFENGTLTFLGARKQGEPTRSFLKNLVLSSAATGWTLEEGKVEQFAVVSAGPVRTVVNVRKSLKDGVSYEKRYSFYARRFEVDISVNKPAGNLYSRAHYSEKGTLVDDKGNTAVVDGTGDAESVSGRNRQPKWYAVFAPDWAHSCVALTPFENVAYWDAGGVWGSIGFLSANARTSGLRLSYGIHGGARDARFAEEDWRRLTAPVVVAWE